MSHFTIANCYEILGINSDATIKDINTAYKRLALKHHPDKTGGEESSHIEFQKIQQAVEILRDPVRRRKHDLELIKLGRISVHGTNFPHAGGSHWSASAFKRYDENSRYMYSYEQSVHVSPQKQESKEDMKWVEQMLKAEEEFRQNIARQQQVEQMHAQMAAERAGQEENCKLRQTAWEDRPCEAFEQNAHPEDVLEEEPDYFDFYTESINQKEQDIWDKCAQRAPRARDYREEEYYQEMYQEGEKQPELYEDVEDQEGYEEEDEEQQDNHEEEVEDQPELYEGVDYEEEVSKEDTEDQQELYEHEDDDFDDSSLCLDDQLSEYIPSVCESDLDYATAAQSSDSEFKSRFHMESIHAPCAELYENKSASLEEAQKADDDTATFYDLSEAGSSHKYYHANPYLSEAVSVNEAVYNNENEQESEEVDNDDSVNRSSLHDRLSPFVPYFQKKLDDPSGRYAEKDLGVELQGIVMETFCGWLENIRLTVPGAEIPRTGNDPQQCLHLGSWVKQFERPECEVCHRWMPIYTLMCPGCGIQACVDCKFQYEKE
ncbi:chaperone protein DnaJ [Aspergillus udagawae]|uniref:Chaperone protein DnaJ n=1 Tax=Aspergillus udagawae TaxID=91492 RepID=A0A8H3N925_9EURO|nr:chaperone protein DnaJ [Aspergillus udagawae]GFF54734.1 chaperone protein DnaJ [Aspergillus udagawae]GFG23464.1 chaperone protein DnaJ [Aspergillus udagawae]